MRQPNDAEAFTFLRLLQGAAGDYEDGVVSINQAIRLNPQDHKGPHLNLLCFVQTLAGNYAAVIDAYQRNIAKNGLVASPALTLAAAAYEGNGQHDEAVAVSARLRRDFPDFSTLNWNFPPLIRDPGVRQTVTGLMHDAGVPAD